ncbi:MAG: hypothetical protein GY713_14850 [Actinomycetia bacterium]|nr:hypothetical protein [Actinomycetes bacterium]
MKLGWGLVVTVLSLACWGGQLIAWLAPATAQRFGLMEAETDVEPVYWADIRGEAAWDSLSLWPMVIAGALLMAGQDSWAYFGLVGGGAYLYFAGRGIIVRLAMRRRALRIGSADSVRVGLIALAVWGAMATITIVAALVSLEGA